jgi:hypothetical protein
MPNNALHFVYDHWVTNWRLLANDLENIVATKGDILTNNAISPVVLPVGADGQVLSADSTQPTGLKWSSTGGGGEINTGANVGTGLGKVYQSKVSTVLNFRSISAGKDILVTNGATDITLDYKPAVEAINTAAPTVPNPAVSVTAVNINSSGGPIVTGTLADGTTIGQTKTIVIGAKTGTDKYQVNITTMVGGGTGILFPNAGSSADLIWTATGWAVLSANNSSVLSGATAPGISYSLVQGKVRAIRTAWTTVAYFTWINARHATYSNGTVVYHSAVTTNNLDIRLQDVTSNVTLGQQLGVNTTDVHSFSIINPTANADVQLQVKKASAATNSPDMTGCVLEFTV